MKGLIRKDLYILRSVGWLFIAVDLAFSLVPDLRFFAFAAFYTVMLTLMLMQADEQCKWDTLLPMLPVSRRTVVLEAYVLNWVYMALITAMALGSQLIWARFGHIPVNGEYVMMLSVELCIALIAQAITLPLLFRCGTTKGRLIMLILIGACTGFTVFVMSSAQEGFELVLSLLVHLRAWHMLLIGIALSALSIPLSLWGYKKRVLA